MEQAKAEATLAGTTYQTDVQASTAAANAGDYLAKGITGAAQTMYPSNAYSPWGALLTGAGNAISSASQQTQQNSLVLKQVFAF